MQYFMQYGLQRTGTNYVETLIKANFSGNKFINNGYARSLPVHKHFRLYNEKVFIPEPKFLNNFLYKTFDEFDNHLKSLVKKEKINYIVLAKEPISWYVSICKFAEKNKWPGYSKKFINNQYMTDYSLFYKKWLEFSEQSDLILLLRYEDFLSDLNASLDKIKRSFNLEKNNKTYKNIEKVPMSKKFSKRRKNFYGKKKYNELFSKEEMFVLINNLDKQVVEKLGYNLDIYDIEIYT